MMGQWLLAVVVASLGFCHGKAGEEIEAARSLHREFDELLSLRAPLRSLERSAAQIGSNLEKEKERKAIEEMDSVDSLLTEAGEEQNDVEAHAAPAAPGAATPVAQAAERQGSTSTGPLKLLEKADAALRAEDSELKRKLEDTTAQLTKLQEEFSNKKKGLRYKLAAVSAAKSGLKLGAGKTESMQWARDAVKKLGASVTETQQAEDDVGAMLFADLKQPQTVEKKEPEATGLGAKLSNWWNGKPTEKKTTDGEKQTPEGKDNQLQSETTVTATAAPQKAPTPTVPPAAPKPPQQTQPTAPPRAVDNNNFYPEYWK